MTSHKWRIWETVTSVDCSAKNLKEATRKVIRKNPFTFVYVFRERRPPSLPHVTCPKSSMYRTLLLCVHEFRLMENFIFARSEDPVHDGGNCQVECQTKQVMFYRRKYLPMSTVKPVTDV